MMAANVRAIRLLPFMSSAARDLMQPAGSFALLLASEAGVAKAAEADRELLACCQEAEISNREAAAVMNGIDAMDDDDPAVMGALEAAHPLFVSYSDAVLRAGQLATRTPEGLRAKATLLLLHLTTEADPVMLAASLARDVVGRT